MKPNRLMELDICWQEISSRRWWKTWNGCLALFAALVAIIDALDGLAVWALILATCSVASTIFCVLEWECLRRALAVRKTILEARDE